MNFRDSRAFGRAWENVALWLGQFETMEGTGEAHRREAGGVTAVAVLIAAAELGQQALRRDGRSHFEQQLTPPELPPRITLLLVELLRDFRAELEAQSIPDCAREADLALGPQRAVAFLTALTRLFGRSEALDVMRRSIQIDAEELSAAAQA